MHSEAGIFRTLGTLEPARQCLPATVMPSNVLAQA
jgi:hypothetical protein